MKSVLDNKQVLAFGFSILIFCLERVQVSKPAVSLMEYFKIYQALKVMHGKRDFVSRCVSWGIYASLTSISGGYSSDYFVDNIDCNRIQE